MSGNQNNENSIDTLVDNIYKKISNCMTQNTSGLSEELSGRAATIFSSKLSANNWKSLQKWCNWKDGGAILMPDNSRLLYRKGGNTIILQEFSPQMRSLKVSQSLIGGESYDYGKTFYLAFPYVNFIFKFSEGVFSELYCCFMDRPIQKLSDKPKRPFLTNIDGDSLKVCLGSTFQNSQLIPYDYNQQVAYVYDYFWNSTFNSDYRAHYDCYLNHFKSNSKISSYENWQKQSAEDPLFVIDDVDWLDTKNGSLTFEEIIVGALNGSIEDNGLKAELYNNLQEQLIKELVNISEHSVKSSMNPSQSERASVKKMIEDFISKGNQ